MLVTYTDGLKHIQEAYEFIEDKLEEGEKLELEFSMNEWDELDRIEFIMALEESFDIEIEDSVGEGWNNLQMAVDYLIANNYMDKKIIETVEDDPNDLDVPTEDQDD